MAVGGGEARLDTAGRLRASRALARRDPVLRSVIRRVGPCRLRRRHGAYRFLVRSVLYQQLAGAAAAAIEARLRAAFGGRIPSAEVLREAPEASLREAGLSRQKIAALRSIAEAFAEGHVRSRSLYRMPDEEVVRTVTTIRGVGEWTAHMLLMFCLGRGDVLPVGDYGVRKAAWRLYRLDALPGPRELVSLAEPWRPYRSVASWYLWRSHDVVTL